ncbi:MAG: hypothetical protein ACLUEK_10455 [Oscillospiraceae bacterium]
MKPKELTADAVWREYEKMLAYNDSIQLDDTVRVNENFFIGKQWEGVESNGLPTPVFNFLKRVTLFTVASITSDKLKPSARPCLRRGRPGPRRAADVINAEFEALFEHNKLPGCSRSICATPPWTATAPPIPGGRGRRLGDGGTGPSSPR